MGAESIGLFGSFTSGGAEAASDIDILVAFQRGEKNFRNYMNLKSYLEELFAGYMVDLVIEEALKPGIRPHILKSVIYAS